MLTKAMRSASSEDIRSEARRAIRTREGKDCHQDIVPFTGIRPFGSAPSSADHGSLVQVGTSPSGFVLGGQTTDTLYCRDVHNVER
jgi:hypothetical protein